MVCSGRCSWEGSLRSSSGEKSGPSSVPFVLLVFIKQLWMLRMVICIALKVEKVVERGVKRESVWVIGSNQSNVEAGAAAGNALPWQGTQTA